MGAIGITRAGRAALVAALCALLVACGGGDDGAPGAPIPSPVTPGPEIPPAPPPPVPPPPPPPPPPPGANSSACGDMGALLAAINAARAQARSCGGTAMPGVAALSWNAKLAAAADRHSRDMAEKNFFSHTGSDGSTASARVTAAGYNWSWTGENIAAGYTTIGSVVQGWLNSPGHCANIMNANYQEFGAACRYNSNATYRYYWTTDFGRPR